MKHYADKTTISVNQSIAEIERILARYGADQFVYARGIDEAGIAFVISSPIGEKRQAKIIIPIPPMDDPKITRTPTGRRRKNGGAEVQRLWEQEVRRRWRVMALAIKAKFEAIDCGITSFDQEFLANIMLADGETVLHKITPQINEAYLTGNPAPKLLLGR